MKELLVQQTTTIEPDSEREKIVKRIDLLKLSLNHVSEANPNPARWWKEAEELDRLKSILELSDTVGVPVSRMIQKTRDDHNKIHELILKGDIEMAKKTALQE